MCCKLMSLIVFLLILALPVSADGISAAVEDANGFYRSGNFKEAAELYEKAIQAGVGNGHLLYNAANAHYRMESYAKAFALYSQALKQLPRDPDIYFNLQLTKERLESKIARSSNENDLVSRLLLFLPTVLSEFERQVLFLLLNLVFWGLVIFNAVSPRAVNRLVFTTSLLFLFGSAVLAYGVRYNRNGEAVFALTPSSHALNPAIVVNPLAKVYSGDALHFQVIAIAKDGEVFEVEESRGIWSQVQLPQGRKGWIQTEHIEYL